MKSEAKNQLGVIVFSIISCLIFQPTLVFHLMFFSCCWRQNVQEVEARPFESLLGCRKYLCACLLSNRRRATQTKSKVNTRRLCRFRKTNVFVESFHLSGVEATDIGKTLILSPPTKKREIPCRRSVKIRRRNRTVWPKLKAPLSNLTRKWKSEFVQISSK